MKVSILMFIRDSHEMLRRQIIHMNSLKIPLWAELIIVDHANTPPLEFVVKPNFNAKIVRCEDRTPWIIPTLINLGRKHCCGEYIQIIGVDHMLSYDWIRAVGKTKEQYAHFTRYYALLNVKGEIEPVFKDNGRAEFMSGSCGVKLVKMSIWDALGGYDGTGCGEDLRFRFKYKSSKFYKPIK